MAEIWVQKLADRTGRIGVVVDIPRSITLFNFLRDQGFHPSFPREAFVRPRAPDNQKADPAIHREMIIDGFTEETVQRAVGSFVGRP